MMTYNDIIKKLEMYKNIKDDDTTISSVKAVLLKYAYLLLKGQQAEIELLENEKASLINACDTNEFAAMKELAEDIKMAFYYEFDELIPSVMADKIDSLVEKAKEQYVKGWISVNDRLPDKAKYDWVLVIGEFLEGGYFVPHVAELRDGIWYASEYERPFEDLCAVKVTHWKPLPPDPKKSEESSEN